MYNEAIANNDQVTAEYEQFMGSKPEAATDPNTIVSTVVSAVLSILCTGACLFWCFKKIKAGEQVKKVTKSNGVEETE